MSQLGVVLEGMTKRQRVRSGDCARTLAQASSRHPSAPLHCCDALGRRAASSIAAAAVGLTGIAPPAVAASLAAPPPPTALTRSGLMQARFEATWHEVMGSRPACVDSTVKVALRFVVCGSPAARYVGYMDAFRGRRAPPFSLARRAPPPGSYGVTAVPVQIGAEYLLCQPHHYVLRLDVISFSLGCS
jgi:hypothetical protein